jgi:hypothetical protein
MELNCWMCRASDIHIKNNTSNETEFECPICYELHDKSNITFINCGHYACDICFNKLQNKSNSLNNLYRITHYLG